MPASDINVLMLPSFDPGRREGRESRDRPAGLAGCGGGPRLLHGDTTPRRTHATGEKVLLVRQETSPEDVGGMHAAEGILTAVGGMTSHAAVVARGWGKCCVAGAGDRIAIDAQVESPSESKTYRQRGRLSHRRLDAARSWSGEMAHASLRSSPATSRPCWTGPTRSHPEGAHELPTPRQDAQRAREFGAQGIGLCRTEHMFFEGDRIKAMRQMILANDHESIGRRR